MTQPRDQQPPPEQCHYCERPAQPDGRIDLDALDDRLWATPPTFLVCEVHAMQVHPAR